MSHSSLALFILTATTACTRPDESAQTIAVYKVDAFATKPFEGNPAAVCLLEQPQDDQTLQAIAAEMNFTETAFVLPDNGEPPERAASFSLRWFSPETEVPLCGHATLASAAVLFDELHSPHEVLTFTTKSGILTAKKDGRDVALELPLNPPIAIDPPPNILAALGVTTVVATQYSAKTQKLLVRLADERAVRAVHPSFAAMKAIVSTPPIKGVIVTAAGSGDYDFVSRYFAPWVGVDEDPVTGSAHTVLVPYWSGLLEKEVMTAYQASPRGGVLHVRRNATADRVTIAGPSIVLVAGRLRLP